MNLFQNNPATTSNLFGNAAGTGTSNNLFNNQGATGQQPTNNPLFSNNTSGFPQQQAPTNNLFANQQTTTPGLFNQQPVGSTAPNMFGGAATTAPSNTLFSQTTTTTNTGYFPVVGQPPQPGTNPFPGTNAPAQPNQQFNPNMTFVGMQQQVNNDAIVIAQFKKGSLVRMIDEMIPDLSDANGLRGISVRSLSQDSYRKLLVPIQKSINETVANCESIRTKNLQLFSLMETYNGIMRDRLTLLKKIFLEVVQSSNLIRELSSTLDRYQRLAESEFETFYQSLSSGGRYGSFVVSPSEFEMELSSFVLRKARDLLQQLTDYQGCQEASDEASYIEVVPALIEYYKNVACLMNEFREKYAKFKDELARRSRSSGYDLEGRLESVRTSELTRNTDTYAAIIEAQKLLKQKIEHCQQTKNRYRPRE